MSTHYKMETNSICAVSTAINYISTHATTICYISLFRPTSHEYAGAKYIRPCPRVDLSSIFHRRIPHYLNQ